MSGNLRHIALDWLLRIQQSPEDAVLRSELAAWLAANASHVEAYRKAERVWRLTGMAQAAAETAAHSAVPLATMPASPVARPLRARRRRWPALLAGSLAACLLVFVAPDAYLSYQSDYRTGLGERRSIELDDGSRVRLDSQSAIRIAYTGNRREVQLLAGQAFFEVVPDKARPFIVDADALRIRVTGTAFNVAIRPHQLAIAVQQGSVRVSEGDTTLADALQPGDRLRWHEGEDVLRDTLPVNQIAAWQQGKLVVRDARIADVLDELRSYLPGQLVLRNAALGEKRITGVYDLSDPDAALRALVEPYRGKVSAWTDWLRVVDSQH